MVPPRPPHRPRHGWLSPTLVAAAAGVLLALRPAPELASLDRRFVGSSEGLEVAAPTCGSDACAADTPHVALAVLLDGVDHGGGPSLPSTTGRRPSASARRSAAPASSRAPRSRSNRHLTYSATAPPRAA